MHVVDIELKRIFSKEEMNLLFQFINPKGRIAPCYTLKASLLWIHNTFQALSIKKKKKQWT
jgi:hypothetical protein